MKQGLHRILVILSIVAWLILIITQYTLLRDSYSLTSSQFLSDMAADVTAVINPVDGKNAPNDFLVQYADLFAKTVQAYGDSDAVPKDSIPFHYPQLDSFANEIVSKVQQLHGDDVEFAMLMEQWGPIDDNNNYEPVQHFDLSIENKILGNLQSLNGSFSQSSFSSTEQNVFFHVLAYYKFNNVKGKILGKIKVQLALALLSIILLTALLVWTLRRLFQLHREQKEQHEFVDNIRHTFQTPLTTINVASASQMRYLAEGNQEAARKMGSYVHAQTARLQRIIDQLNTNAGLDLKQALNIREISLATFFGHCQQDMKIKYAHRPVDIIVTLIPDDLNMKADPFFLKTAILNVLDNAFQYNENDEDLHVEISAQEINQEITIQIADNGIGIDYNELQKLGKKYYRPAQHSHIGGLGLGLYQATQIVAAHGGSIQFLGDTTAGFTVIMKIPNE